MPHTGVFSFLGNESNLASDTDDFLLLKAGVADENAAKAQATSFLVDIKKFRQNQRITVEGATSSLGTVRTILMTNASAAALPLGFARSAAGARKKTKKKTRSSEKARKSSSKTTARAKSSKKKIVKKARAESRTKTKAKKTASKTARKKSK
ncbi:MAG TPA: hypothetical protein VFB65_03780 [Pyrinomonadaceae bacterium]|nr:hypothetical protein [Pyrinomonadaceae bacterium]